MMLKLDWMPRALVKCPGKSVLLSRMVPGDGLMKPIQLSWIQLSWEAGNMEIALVA